MSIPEQTQRSRERASELALRAACTALVQLQRSYQQTLDRQTTWPRVFVVRDLPDDDPRVTAEVAHYQRVGAEQAHDEVQRWTLTDAGRAYLAAHPTPEEPR